MEAAARAEAGLRDVLNAWDKEDESRERREQYHEIGRDKSQVPLEYNMSKEEIVIPASIYSVYWRQIIKGDFLESIFDCLYELHELVTDNDISLILKGLSEKQKAFFSFLPFAVTAQYNLQSYMDRRIEISVRIEKLLNVRFTKDYLLHCRKESVKMLSSSEVKSKSLHRIGVRAMIFCNCFYL